VLVTGTPGTGKTAVSKTLAELIGAAYFSLNQFVITHRAYSSLDRQRHTRVVDLERTRRLMTKALAKGKTMAIIDTHIPDAIPKSQVRMAIVLRCHPKTLERRLRKKGWSARKIRENVLAEILDSCYVSALGYYGGKKIAQIDTTKTSVRKSASQAKRVILNGTSGEHRIDWIKTLKREHSLGEYLSS
jgi:adenylate kinase